MTTQAYLILTLPVSTYRASWVQTNTIVVVVVGCRPLPSSGAGHLCRRRWVKAVVVSCRSFSVALLFGMPKVLESFIVEFEL
jgi:hypothetical protein